MKFLFSLLHPFWVACCALTMMAQTRMLLGFPLSLGWLDGFVFGGTVFGYYCTHPNHWKRGVAWASGLMGGICFLLPMLNTPQLLGKHLIVGIPVLFWLAYYGFQRPGNAGLRSLPLAKPLTIALAWAWVTVLLPSPVEAWSNLIFILLGRAAFIFSLALAYDLCDLEYDQQQGLPTLAVQLGFEKSMTLVYKSLAFSAVCVFANWHLHVYDGAKAAALLLSLAFSTWCIPVLLQKKDWSQWQKPLIDGLMVLQFLLVLLF